MSSVANLVRIGDENWNIRTRSNIKIAKRPTKLIGIVPEWVRIWI